MPAATPFPTIVWDSPSGIPQYIEFGDYLTDFSSQYHLFFDQSETIGGVQAHYPRGAYDEVSVEYLGAWDQAFADKVRAWWGHAASGRIWDFFFEADNSLTALVNSFSIADSYMKVDNVTQRGRLAPLIFISGRPLVVHPALGGGDLGKRDAFIITSSSETVPGSGIWYLAFSGTLAHSHSVGEQVRSRYGYPSCVVLQSDYPLAEEPGNIMRFSLRFRSFVGIAVP